MKKVLFLASALVVLSLSSCRKDYTCTYTLNGYEYSTTCLKCNKADVKVIEDQGYDCEKK